MPKMLTETILTNLFSIIGRFSKSISYWTAERSRQNFHSLETLYFLKGTVSRDFLLLVFFMNQFPPSPWVYYSGRFEFFRKFAEIFPDQGWPPVSATPVANLPPVSAGINDTGGKFATGINDTGGKFCHQFHQCCWYRWQICHRWQRCRRQRHPWQIATGINDTSGKFATGVFDTGGKQGEQCQAADTSKWTWRQKFIYMLSLLSQGVPTKLLKFFLLKIFFICHRCQRHRWSTLSCECVFELYLKRWKTTMSDKIRVMCTKSTKRGV